MAKYKKKRKLDDDEEDEEQRRWHDDLRPETKRSVWAIISFVAAVVLLLAWFGKAGLAGAGISSFFTLLFGKMFLVVPAALLLAGISFLFGMRQRVFGGTLLGALLFLISVLGLGEIIWGPQTSGYVGFGIVFTPLRFFDVTASLVIFGALLIISLLFMFNTALVPQRKDTQEEEQDTTRLGLFRRMLNGVRGVRDDVPVIAVAPAVIPTTEVFLTPSGQGGADQKNVRGEDAMLENFDEEKLPKKPLVTRRVPSSYKPPPLDLLENDRGKPSSGDVRANANVIQRTLQNFGIDVDMGEVNIGPSVTQYTLKPAEGVKLSRITNLSSNLGLALAAHPLRIEAPIPGRSLVGIEVPNKSIAFVGLRNILGEFVAKKQEYILGFALGRDVTGQAVFADLAHMPHLLIAGSTGSGKSVTIHSLLLGLVFSNPPELLRLILIDPKRVELAYYNGMPHLMTPVVTEAKRAIQALRWATKEMDRRYGELQAAGVRDIGSYNNGNANGDTMPYLVIVIDELADLMATYPREVEASIVRIAQMARAVGIHLVVSTQRPSVEVITGLIKANITTRIALQVASQIDSRTIIDIAGAEKLLGKGDMLYLPGDAAKPRRIQGVYVSENEVKRVTQYLSLGKELFAEAEEEQIDMFSQEQAAGNDFLDQEDTDDALYEDARALVVSTGKASTSFLQRRLRLGYARAARLIDILEDRGVVSAGDGAKPREVLISRDSADEASKDDVHEV
ncbi:MAG: DNA segregation ATPase FtsK/SpoIIIE, S-DNA-T family [Parcubacteria group bacterium Gr01-1014_29]|nr:MAG: DNA segregation ATPase FtsK/SpoIIIE, S-DNA-T family [Parcubacteria group bacterium Gr01-1014_29]